MSEQPRLTVEDLLLLGTDVRAELIHGVIVPKAVPSPRHSDLEAAVTTWPRQRFHRVPGGRWPGGWLILTEIHVIYSAIEVYCHDVAGWRRDRLGPDLAISDHPGAWAKVRPDWVCEIVSPKHEDRDRVDKLHGLERAGVPHYWIADAERKEVAIHALRGTSYERVLTAKSGDVVRAPPFDEVELRVDVLFGDEDDEDY